MNEAWIRQYVFLGEKGRGVSYDVEIELGRVVYLMMMLDYKERERGMGGGGGQESGKKWLHNLNYVINYVIRKLLSN